jgi:hypothetical protein
VAGPLRRLFFLEKDHHDTRQAVTTAQAFRMCLERIVMRPSQREITDLVLGAAAVLVRVGHCAGNGHAPRRIRFSLVRIGQSWSGGRAGTRIPDNRR